jgi:hypothetical protein
MRAGAGLAVVYGAVYDLTWRIEVGGILIGVFQGLLWLWMAWKSKAGRNWARVLDPERETRRLIAKLQALGHQVTLQPAS